MPNKWYTTTHAPWTTDTQWQNQQFLVAQIQIPIPKNIWDVDILKGLVFVEIMVD